MESKHFKEFSKHDSRNCSPPVLGFFSFDKASQIDQFRCWVFGISEQFKIDQAWETDC